MSTETSLAEPAAGPRPTAMILVVNDEPASLQSLRFVLSMFGFEAMVARSARELFQCVKDRLPDLIITDSTLPSMSGFELCRVLRASQKTRRLPVVLHTGVQLRDDVPRLFDQVITRSSDADVFETLFLGLIPPSMQA